jgi:GAF domain-containing protein
MSEPSPSPFVTSNQPPDSQVTAETDRMLDEVLLTLRLERAVIFVKMGDSWQVSSAHEVPTDDFWNIAPISLSVVESAAAGEIVHLVDAPSSEKFGSKDSVILTGIRSVACAPYTDSTGHVRGLLYADNRIEKGAFSPDDVNTLQELANEMGRRLFG